MTRPFQSLDPAALAASQNAILRGGIPVPATARAQIRELEAFGRPLLGALRWLPKGTLFIRQQTALSALHFRSGNLEKSALFIHAANEALEDCLSGGFYGEGWSRLLYCKEAYDFWTSITGMETALPFAGAFANYRALLSPEGTLAVNDTRRLDARPLLGNLPPAGTHASPPDFLHPRYSVFRFPPDAFVILTHDAGFANARLARHGNYDFGHFALYARGKWRVGHNWYQGWDAKRAGDGGECFAQNVLLNGIRTQEPYWRIGSAPRHSVKRLAYNRIALDCGGPSRVFTVTPEYLDVEDEGGEASVFNFDAEGCAGAAGGFVWTHSGEIEFDGTGSDGRRRAWLTGRTRSARFWF